MSSSTEKRLACWKIAKKLSATQLDASVDDTADRIYRWIEASDNPAVAYDSIMAAMESRTGGASIDQLLTQATAAYTFATSSCGVAPKPRRRRGSRKDSGPSSQ